MRNKGWEKFLEDDLVKEIVDTDITRRLAKVFRKYEKEQGKHQVKDKLIMLAILQNVFDAMRHGICIASIDKFPSDWLKQRVWKSMP